VVSEQRPIIGKTLIEDIRILPIFSYEGMTFIRQLKQRALRILVEERGKQ
jgi:hypothetical protein